MININITPIHKIKYVRTEKSIDKHLKIVIKERSKTFFFNSLDM